MNLRNMYRLSDSTQHKERRTYDRAVNIWGGEVCGGGLAAGIGSLAFIGAKISEHASSFSDTYYAGTSALAIAGIAVSVHGWGRLQEMARLDLVQSPTIEPVNHN